MATFNFREGTINTKIVWADDGDDTPMNEAYRQGMGVSAKQETILKSTTIKGESRNGNKALCDY